MMTAFYLFLTCGLVMIIASHMYPGTLKKEANALVWENWREPLRCKVRGRGLDNYRVLALVVFVTFVVLYYVLR